MAVSFNEYMPRIWNRLLSVLGNEYAVAGVMGNLYAESGCTPWACQPSRPYATCMTYISKVDNGTITKSQFCNRGCSANGGVASGKGGFGLAQWTEPSRKEGLYNLWENSSYSSIGDLDLQLDWLITELTNYGLISSLQSCTSVREASDIILLQYEKPKDQSESVKQLRESYGVDIYNQYSGSTPIEPPTPTPPPDPQPPDPQDPIVAIHKHKMPIWMYPMFR